MTECTLTSNDIVYLGYYLKEKDPTTNIITAFDLTSASSIVFRMRLYGSTVNTINVVMATMNIEGSLNTDGYCRVLCTIPTGGTYCTEVEYFTPAERLTWKGPTYFIETELG